MAALVKAWCYKPTFLAKIMALWLAFATMLLTMALPTPPVPPATATTTMLKSDYLIKSLIDQDS
jgi:hypothetical protein